MRESDTVKKQHQQLLCSSEWLQEISHQVWQDILPIAKDDGIGIKLRPHVENKREEHAEREGEAGEGRAKTEKMFQTHIYDPELNCLSLCNSGSFLLQAGASVVHVVLFYCPSRLTSTHQI